MAEMIRLTDPKAKELEFYTGLNEAQLRHYFEPYGGVFVAESAGVISLALDAGCRPISMLVPQKEAAAAQSLIQRVGEIPIYVVGEEVTAEIRGFSLICGPMCAMHRPTMLSEAEILQNCRRIAVLEGVENPTNVGAIIRSAAALGMDAVLLTQDCSDPLYRRAARVSMGTVFQIPWTYLSSEKPFYVSRLQAAGFTTAAMALRKDSLCPDDAALRQEKLAILLGSEGYGLPEQTIEACDHTVMIPMHRGVDSLNVAAASAVAFWQMGRR